MSHLNFAGSSRMMNDSQTAKSRLLAAVICFAHCWMLAGCRTSPHTTNHIEILNAERRVLEDQIYEQQYEYERVVSELEEVREELKALQDGVSGRSRDDGRFRPEVSDDDEMLELSPPSVTPGVLEDPQIEIPELPAPTDDEGAASPFWDSAVPVNADPSQLTTDDPWITHIHIDSQRTGGSDFDQQPGDDGLMVVIQPRNSNNDFVPLAGSMSVVALDYSRREDGDAARIARWDLNARQVDEAIVNNETEQGIFLRLAWSEKQPDSNRLMVAVRYNTVDGRKLEAQHDIFVTLPGQISQRWTPRSTNRRDDSEARQNTNIARQPSLNDEAFAPATTRLPKPAQSDVSPASYSPEASDSRRSVTRPVWRPHR